MKNFNQPYLIPVTAALTAKIASLKNGHSWRQLRDTIPGWRWSHTLLSDIVSGKTGGTSLAVYEVLGVAPPMVIIAGPGSVIIGSGPGLLGDTQQVVFIAIPPEQWRKHSIECAVCGVVCPRWSSTQKYCERHSWVTGEGRKYWRAVKVLA